MQYHSGLSCPRKECESDSYFMWSVNESVARVEAKSDEDLCSHSTERWCCPWTRVLHKGIRQEVDNRNYILEIEFRKLSDKIGCAGFREGRIEDSFIYLANIN